MFKRISGRILALVPAALLQIAVIVLLCTVLRPVSAYVYFLLDIVAVITAIKIVSLQDVTAYKQSWMLFILIVPFFGILMYLLFANKKTGGRLRTDLEESGKALAWNFPGSKYVTELKPGPDKLRAAESLYHVSVMTGMPIYCCGETRYYPVGEACLPDLREDLKKAEKFIFMEYFILQEGEFLGQLVDVLEERAKAGVDVRVMYDDLGSIGTYSQECAQKLRDRGIKVVSFNPIKYITPRVNNRDHRKMTVIDGKVAYSGGINISDEYINVGSEFGHWKDLAFRLEGDAAINYTYMFIEFWNAFEGDKLSRDLLPASCSDAGENGFVLSYYENPVNRYHTSNTLYIDMLSQATEYIWFYTPYLMLDDSLMFAFINAARRGVDVRILMPGIPDKKMVYRISRSYYGPLMEAGVRIFEYTPGFVHAKACVCDGRIAAIGTVNLDFRSLFLHFENNSVFYGSTIVEDLHKDMAESFEKCLERKPGDGLPGTKYGIIEALLRVIAPLL